MMKFFKPVKGKIAESERLEKKCWIDCVEPSEEELKKLSRIAKIPLEDLKMPLDEEERSRIEVAKRFLMVIYRVPYTHREKEEAEILTAPMGIFITPDYVITIHLYHTRVLHNIIERGKKESLLKDFSYFTTEVLFEITKRYFQILRGIDQELEELEDEIKAKKADLNRIADIRKLLVYFHRALIANRVVILTLTEKTIKFFEKDVEKLRDLHTETFQLIEMSGTYRDIVIGMLEFHESKTSTSMRDTMKIMTMVVSILAILIILSNMNLVFFYPGSLPFFLLYIITGIIIFISLMYMLRKR